MRTVIGISSSEISDDDLDDIIYDIEYQIERYFNTTFTPTVEYEVQDGTGKETIFTNKVPLLSVRSVKNNETTLDVSKLNFKHSGQIRLGQNSTNSYFTRKKQAVILKYIYGRVVPTTTQTQLNGPVSAGTSVALTVDDITDFSDGDWIEIYGDDGFKEVAQISGTPSGTTITVDELSYDHSDDSLIKKMGIPVIFERLMKISAALAMVARFVGQSYDDITGYDIGEFHVQKGEPYTQWRETAVQLIKERNDILSRVQPTPAIIV